MPSLPNIKGQVSIYSGAKQLAVSNEIDFTNGGSYTFSVSSTNDSELYTVKITSSGKDYRYQDIKFDSSAGDSFVQYEYPDYKVLKNTGSSNS